MKILFHPKINWKGWQIIKESSVFQGMSSGEQICLRDRLPLKIWRQEFAAARHSRQGNAWVDEPMVSSDHHFPRKS